MEREVSRIANIPCYQMSYSRVNDDEDRWGGAMPSVGRSTDIHDARRYPLFAPTLTRTSGRHRKLAARSAGPQSERTRSAQLAPRTRPRRTRTWTAPRAGETPRAAPHQLQCHAKSRATRRHPWSPERRGAATECQRRAPRAQTSAAVGGAPCPEPRSASRAVQCRRGESRRRRRPQLTVCDAAGITGCP